MPITGHGWELLVIRRREETRKGVNYSRTVSTYQVFHDGQDAGRPSGQFVERGGPGDNTSAGDLHDRRIAAGSYPLSTHDGANNEKYKTIGYSISRSLGAIPRPCLRLLHTGARTGILIHPASGYVWSVGCLNPGISLSAAGDNIKWSDSRARVIALLDDLKGYLGTQFPTHNNTPIPRAACLIEELP